MTIVLHKADDIRPMDSAKHDCILVVDDSQENLDFIQIVLESADYQTVLAKDGETALANLAGEFYPIHLGH